MDDTTAIAELQKAIADDPTDARARLRLAEHQASAGDFASAAGALEWVGKFYAEQGYVLKSVAAYKQLRTLLRDKAPGLGHQYAHVLPLLANLLARVGLSEEAAAVIEEVADAVERQNTNDEARSIPDRVVALVPDQASANHRLQSTTAANAPLGRIEPAAPMVHSRLTHPQLNAVQGLPHTRATLQNLEAVHGLRHVRPTVHRGSTADAPPAAEPSLPPLLPRPRPRPGGTAAG